MAAGDLITRNYQYEYNGVLMGSGTDYIVEGLEGLWDLPEIRTGDIERNDGHGDVPGEDLMGPRVLEADIKAVADTQTAMESSMLAIARALQPRSDDIPLVWQRPGQVRKFVWARPRKRAFPSKYEMARGLAEGTVQFYCADPVIYALAEKTGTVTLSGDTTNADGTVTAGEASDSATFTNDGDWETWPRLTITGAGTNPRISNQNDGNRQVRIDVTMGANDTLVIDAHPSRRTVTLNGVDRYDLVRTDNQWWRMVEGANLITFSRTGTTATQTLEVAWRDAWV